MDQTDLVEHRSLSLMPQTVALNAQENWQHPEDNILLDDVLAREVARGERLPTIRVWRHAPKQGLVVSKRDVASANKADIYREMMHVGWPIIVRPTGGTAVPHGEGVLNLSLLFPRVHQTATTDAYYRLLCGFLIGWLDELGLKGVTGALPGSYCDGNYNVLVDGKKLVGTAQAWRGGLAGIKSRHPGFVLAHACIVIDVNLELATKAMNQFYTVAGDSYRVDASTSTTLRRLLTEHNLFPATEITSAWAQQSLLSFIRSDCNAQDIEAVDDVTSTT